MRSAFAVVLVLAVAAAAGCDAFNARKGSAMDEQVALAAALAPSLVRVEYTMRYDNGEAPMSGDTSFREERPTEVVGFLVSPTQVVTLDRIDYPRFIESVAVRLADDVVKAKFAGFAADHQACLLELERPLKDGKPLVFDASKGPPYLSVTCGEWAGAWTTQSTKYCAVDGVDRDGSACFALPRARRS